MNICILTLGIFRPTMDGASDSILELARFLHDRGSRVTLHCLYFDAARTYVPRSLDDLEMTFDRGDPDRRCESVRTLRLVDTDFHVFPSSANVADVTRNVIDRIRSGKTEFVFSFDSDAITLAAARVVGVRGAHVFHSVDNVIRMKSNPVGSHLLRGYRIFTVSEFMQKRIARELGVESTVWPPFFGVERYRVIRRRRTLATIGYCAGGPAKGDAIVGALVEGMPDVRFLIMGDPVSFGSRSSHLRHLGRISDTTVFYREADVVVIPSLVEESFSRVAMAAMASGVPVVASRIGALPETVGEGGALIDVGAHDNVDPDRAASMFANVISKLKNDERSYRDLCARAMARADEYAARHAETSERVLREIVPRSMAPGPQR